ncbi:MAG TPA: carbamoyltransferase C-terminal domain-containing protein, partial [Candidatus Omnitrophota bacterium]|nr:carbamoyltransferase C-terminal domain-containing protein [Candidatus Omnitrophota bacterium]
ALQADGSRDNGSLRIRDLYLGPSFTNRDVLQALGAEEDGAGSNGEWVAAPSGDVRFRILENAAETAAQFIIGGEIVLWFQGRMEWGARALGNRSILADPRREEIKNILNERIKKREWFRPFAPSILEEKAGEYFQRDYPDNFMSKVSVIKAEKRRLVPAVAHIDGTGRLQTVSKEKNRIFYRLIEAFNNLTGIPMLLNTSFNENEPIVCCPSEAIDCFLHTRMDVLVMGKFIITR